MFTADLSKGGHQMTKKESEARIWQSRHDELARFKHELWEYIVPKQPSIYGDYDVYERALEQMESYFNGELSLEDIFYDFKGALRNALILWTIDKNFAEKFVGREPSPLKVSMKEVAK